MIKRLAGCIREYKRDTLLAPGFMILEVAMEVIIPYLIADLIDNGITKGNMNHILKIGIFLAFVALFSMAFGMLSGMFGATASAGFAKNLRQDIFYNIQNFSFSNIDNFSASSLITRLTTDVTNVQNAFQMLIRMTVRSLIMLVLALIMSFSVNAKISLIFVGAVPILGIGLYTVVMVVHPTFVKVFKIYDKLNKIVQENLRGIRVVKSFVRENDEENKFKDISSDIYTKFVSAEKIIAFNAPLMQFCMHSCMLLAAWVGAQLIVGGEMSTGQLMTVITYAMQILMSLMMLSMVFVMIIISRNSAERISEVLSEKSDLTNCKNPVYKVKDGGVSFKNVDFSYTNDKTKLCLKNISLEIKSGETIGIIGGTGSSKTSLVQLVSRLYDVTDGQVMVGGVDVKNYDIETLRNEVSVVLQKNILFSGTIFENLRWGNEGATDDEVIKAARLAQADGFISSFPEGYNTHIEQGGSNVSGGQRQRLCIARALLKNPKILILDDSTSAVDTKTDSLIRKAFREEIPNVTKLIIAQRISSVQDADRIIVIDGGKIEAVGTHEQLLNESNIYSEVYNSQVKGADFDEAK